MRKCRPLKWVPWAFLGAGLPLLAAGLLSTPYMKADVVARSRANLAASDLTRWADVTLDGRIARISGKSTNQAALAEAAKSVAAVYGVRKVVNTASYAPLSLVSPTIESVTATAPVAEVRGTWPEGTAKTLTVTVDGTPYVLGTHPELTSAEGQWLLKLATPLAEGSHDVTATASLDSDGATITQPADAPAKIIVDLPEPVPVPVPEPEPQPVPQPVPEPAPEPAAVADTIAPAAPVPNPVAADAIESRSLSGSYDAADTAKLTATFEGRQYVLGRGAALVAGESAGAFTFTPNTARLAPGKYDAQFAASDVAGNVSTVAVPQSIIIPEPQLVAKAEAAAAPDVAAPVALAAPVAPVALATPTVDRQLDLTGAPLIRGTWPEAEGTTLSIALAGKTYDLGSSANLRSDGAGKWRLLPSAALKDGIYDVVATARTGDQIARDQTVAEVEVDATLPSVPTVASYASDVAPTALTGTYDAAHAKSLKVALPEAKIAAELGAAGSALAADDAGNWTLTLAQPIAPGTYNVVVTSADERGRMVEDAAAGEVVISAANQPAPKTDAPYDCAAVMARISSVFPMRFIYDKIDFDERFGLSVSQYAALLKDPRCATINVELGGHADSRGTDAYNEDLAERRAARVRDMIVEAGIASSRLSVASYGESQPLDTSETDAGWARNRRVDVKIMK
jgi:outer membrane protein OmpA-like peptidoglycan-associated protein